MVYRLEYTVETMDGTKRVNAQHYALVAIVDQRATLKLGNRLPLVTGSREPDAGAGDLRRCSIWMWGWASVRRSTEAKKD